MFTKNFKIAVRNLFKQKLFTSINVFGLAIGFAGSLLISVFVWNELSYESMHENADNIYRIAVQFGKTDESMILAGAMPGLGPAAKSELPEVEDYVRIYPDSKAQVKISDNEFEESKFFFADESIFNLFTIKVISEVDDAPLSDPSDIMLSESNAIKYFGTVTVIGKIIYYRGHALKVTGVYEDVLGNTQINPGIIASYKTKEVLFPVTNQWGSFGQDLTYLLLNNKVTEEELENKLTALLVKNTSQQMADMLRLIPEHFSSIHLNSNAIGDLIPHGNKSYVYLFSTIALFVLFIASLNFINLSTARSFNRAKEVGIKKVLGAKRNHLVYQFLTESLLVTFLALIIGILLFEIFHPLLTRYLDIQIGINHLKSVEFYAIVFTIFLTVGLFSGLYPAFYLTRFNPIRTVKNDIMKSYKGIGFRKGLVVVQFIISILLIFGTTVIFQQINYMQNHDIGMNKENIVLLNFSPNSENSEEKYEILKTKLLSSNTIRDVSAAYTLPGLSNIEKGTIKLKDDIESKQVLMRFNGVDYNFINTFGLILLDGRNFSKEYSTDKGHSIILNESAVKTLGVKDIIGKQFVVPSQGAKEKIATVIGVIKDFNLESLHKEIEPIVLYINPKKFYAVAVKINPGNNQAVVNYIEQTWKEILPEQEFSYSFFEDKYNSLYSSEGKISRLFTIFSFLAVYIASLGLLGLTSFAAEQRKKEIGIRKVLGSSVKGIVVLLTKKYLKLVFIASIISLPLAYYLMNKWLQDFAYRIEISWFVFVLSVLVALLIALSTVSIQAIKAASSDPIKSIRYE